MMIPWKGQTPSFLLHDKLGSRIRDNIRVSFYQWLHGYARFLGLSMSNASGLIRALQSFSHLSVAGISCWYRTLQANRIYSPQRVLAALHFFCRTIPSSWHSLLRALRDTFATAKVHCGRVKSASVVMRNQMLRIPNGFDFSQNIQRNCRRLIPISNFLDGCSFFKAFKNDAQRQARAFENDLSSAHFRITGNQVRMLLKNLLKQFIAHGFIILLFLVSVQPLKASAIIEKTLDEAIVYEVPTAWRAGNTTILFPSEISALYGKDIATQEQPNARFVVSFVPGNYYVTLRALERNAEDYLTVIYNRKAYIFHLVAADQPYRTLTLFSPKRSAQNNAPVTPSQLLSLLDKAKTYSLFQAQYPDALEGVAHVSPNIENPYQNFTVRIRDVWRFEAQDTIVFSLELINHSQATISYKKQDLAVRLGERIYTQSIVDASGSMPPNSTTPVFFAITGDGGGGRNNLAPDNNWSVLILRESTGAKQ